MSPSTTGSRSAPSILGIENPYTSASRMPTVCPARTREIARLTVTEDFPTPPFPEPIPTTRVWEPAWRKAGVGVSACPCPWPCP